MNSFEIIHIKKQKNAFYLLLDFNKKINIYSTEAEMINTINKFLTYGNPIGILHDKELIAYYNLYCNNTETLVAYFGNLYVLDSFRRNGLAKKLVQFALDYATEQGFKTMLLHVATDNEPAIKLYESMHFFYTGNMKTIGIEECYEMQRNLGE